MQLDEGSGFIKDQGIYPSLWKTAVGMDVPSVFKSIKCCGFLEPELQGACSCLLLLPKQTCCRGERGNASTSLRLSTVQLKRGCWLVLAGCPPSTAQLLLWGRGDSSVGHGGIGGMFIGFSCSVQQVCSYMLPPCQEGGGSRAYLGGKKNW